MSYFSSAEYSSFPESLKNSLIQIGKKEPAVRLIHANAV